MTKTLFSRPALELGWHLRESAAPFTATQQQTSTPGTVNLRVFFGAGLIIYVNTYDHSPLSRKVGGINTKKTTNQRRDIMKAKSKVLDFFLVLIPPTLTPYWYGFCAGRAFEPGRRYIPERHKP